MAKKPNNPTLWIITLMVIAVAVAYYFWESYLYVHYLGGYDQFGLPTQESASGFHFFFQAWPLWLFPVIVTIVVAWLIYLVQRSKKEGKENRFISQMKADEKRIEALEEEIQMLKSQQNLHRADSVKEKNKLDKKLIQAEKEFIALMDEYQQSLEFIKNLLEKQSDRQGDS